MGVHGLTTFLKENRRSLSRTLELRSNIDPSINLVVDGWSLIYAVYSNSGEPWVYGGEYGALGRHVETIVSSWISVGIRPVFVFDGPAPSLKYPTVISRLQNNCVKPANLFFRTSPAARSTPRSLADTRIAPPLGYQTIVSTLLCMGPDVKVEFADGEADPYIVALAARLGAYVMGSDSDFLVLNCEGYKGYVPLDEVTWTASVKDQNIHSPESSVLSEEYGSEFQTVTRKKQKQKSKAKESRIELGTGILPPTLPVDSDVTLVLTIYEPVVFAQHIALPPPLLPLLGALIGNDYASFEFFRFTESPTQRVKRVADTLSSVLKEAQSGNAKKIRKVSRGGQGSVMDVIGTTVERLLIWRDPANPPASGQVDKITEMVVRSTLEYALENPTSSLQNIQAPSPDVQVENAVEQVRRLYLQEFRRGTLHPKVIEVFMTGTCFPRLFLEDPDRECCARSIGQPIREVIWSILSDGGGIPERPEPLGGEAAENDPDFQSEEDDSFEDDDELVDVVEEYSDDELSVEDDEDEDDPLAALRGKLQRLSFSGVDEVPDANDLELPEPESQESNSFVEVIKPPRPKMVTDYIRRGARVVGEESEVRDLHDILPEELCNATPIQLRPMEERLRVFLQVLGSDTPAVLEIARSADCGSKLLSVVTLRWILKILHTRAEVVEEGSRKRERNKEKWTRKEAQALLTCFYDEEEPVEQPQIEHRAIQLTAQVLAALEACGWLAQALLLVDLPGQQDIKGNSTLPILFGDTEKTFSGMKFHSALARSRRASAESYNQVWSAVENGLENTFGEEKGRKRKKDSKSGDIQHLQGVTKAPVGMFGVLAAGLDI